MSFLKASLKDTNNIWHQQLSESLMRRLDLSFLFYNSCLYANCVIIIIAICLLRQSYFMC